MGYVWSAIAGPIGLAIGWSLIAAVALGLGYLFDVSTHEGAFAMMAFFAIGPFGGLAGLLVATALVQRSNRKSGLGAYLAHLAAASLGVAAVAGAVAAWSRLADPFTAQNALPPQLVFEMKLPPGAAPPALVSRSDALARRSSIELETSRNTMAAEIESVRTEQGRPVVTGQVEMYYRARERRLIYKQSSGDVVFEIDLAALPSHAASFGAWQPAKSAPGAVAGYEIRYRAHWDGQ